MSETNLDPKEFQEIINAPVPRLRLPTYKGVPGVQYDNGKYIFSIINISSQEKDKAVCYVSGSESNDLKTNGFWYNFLNYF